MKDEAGHIHDATETRLSLHSWRGSIPAGRLIDQEVFAFKRVCSASRLASSS